jgi:formylglycine-generating enzyme required for sulfatase activity
MTGVSFYEAYAFCRWLSARLRYVLRLPTEQEWEKAARGVDGRAYPWGDSFDVDRCNCEESGIGRVTPVGKYSPAGHSVFGCADMAGNVWEWCLTRWRGNYQSPEDNDPEGDQPRVIRGGAYHTGKLYVRCAYRDRAVPAYAGGDIGFRLVAPTQ